MRPWGALLSGLCLVLPAGCVADRGGEVGSAFVQRFKNFQLADAANFVQLDVALVERRVGDRYVNDEVWKATDEHAVELGRGATLRENGYRVGLVVSMLPTPLQEMLTSERWNTDPRRLAVPVGKPTPVPLGPVQPVCRYQVHADGAAEEFEVAEGRYELVVTAAYEDGKTRLRFVPRVRYGREQFHFRLVEGQAEPVLETSKPVQAHPELAFEVTVASGEYLVIGTDLGRVGTLGCESFLQREGLSPVQRLLVIRTVRPGGGIDSEIAEAPLPDDLPPSRSPPLAWQATLPVARGYRGTGR